MVDRAVGNVRAQGRSRSRGAAPDAGAIFMDVFGI
jgi:hypothetical protein